MKRISLVPRELYRKLNNLFPNLTTMHFGKSDQEEITFKGEGLGSIDMLFFKGYSRNERRIIIAQINKKDEKFEFTDFSVRISPDKMTANVYAYRNAAEKVSFKDLDDAEYKGASEHLQSVLGLKNHNNTISGEEANSIFNSWLNDIIKAGFKAPNNDRFRIV